MASASFFSVSISRRQRRSRASFSSICKLSIASSHVFGLLETMRGGLYVKLLGQCAGCPSADLTSETIVEAELTAALPLNTAPGAVKQQLPVVPEIGVAAEGLNEPAGVRPGGELCDE